jgi:hypothetical protein
MEKQKKERKTKTLFVLGMRKRTGTWQKNKQT